MPPYPSDASLPARDTARASGTSPLEGTGADDGGMSAPRFTRERADAALAYVRPIVGDITGVYREVVAVREQLSTAPPAELPSLEADYDGLMNRLGGLVDELQRAGVELRDFEEGVVAFRGRVADEPASLIWRAGVDAADRVSHFIHIGGSLHDAAPLPAA